MSAKKAEKGTTEDGGKKKPPMMIIVAVVAVIAILGGLFVGKTIAAKGKPGAEKPKKEKGPVLVLDEFLVNLTDPGGDHFLKVTVGLELDKSKGKTPETLKEEVAPIRDAVLTSLSSKSREDLTPEGREKLKAEVKKKVNAAFGDAIVQDVYFTNFVTQ